MENVHEKVIEENIGQLSQDRCAMSSRLSLDFILETMQVTNGCKSGE